MKDKTGREIRYLRLSITDNCNLRCRYCAPAETLHSAGAPLSADEIEEIARAAIALGLDKIRLTGGEPLTRPDLLNICRRVALIPGLRELAMTTNGILLAEYAAALKTAGVNRVNISLDTLDPDKFRTFTRGGELSQVLQGIEAAERVGLTPLKLNVVLMGGENEDEIADFVGLTQYRPINVRFIELMPIGESADWQPERFISGDAVLEACPTLVPEPGANDGVARVYRLPGGVGKIGLISPMSQHFCDRCNRIRVTADGKLKPCLHSDQELSLRGLHGAELIAALKAGIGEKPDSHNMATDRPSEAGRNMHQIGG
ncbi:MAG: GTP 3',8-cyclase MoaA [Oscillospiraceae bacterium]|nr:GTP 3',8-cyclase MoaA [Oscillospiraceae bacterium]